MKVLNLIWGFTPGGVGKCFLTYCEIGRIEPRIEIVSACINLMNTDAGIHPLIEKGVKIIDIKNRLDFSWIGRLNELIEEERPDLIFTHGFNGPVAVLLCRFFKRKHVPIVCSYHGEYHPMTKSRKFLAPFFNGMMHLIYRHFAKAVIGVSNFNLAFLRKCRVPDYKLSYVYNGVRDVCEVLPRPPGFPVLEDTTVKFLVASRIDAIKGLVALIDGFATVKKIGCDIALIIVGDGLHKIELENKVKKLGLMDSVKFIGFRDDIAKWIAHCDVFCLPSFVESFPIGLIEALRAGKPSIVSDAGGIPEVVTKNEALFVKAGDANSIASCIEKVSSDAELRTMLGKSARRRFMENFTEDKMIKGVANWLMTRCIDLNSK